MGDFRLSFIQYLYEGTVDEAQSVEAFLSIVEYLRAVSDDGGLEWEPEFFCSSKSEFPQGCLSLDFYWDNLGLEAGSLEIDCEHGVQIDHNLPPIDHMHDRCQPEP